jgi:hypothetical protein
MKRRRYAYRAYDGGPDPLAPPFDLREAIDRIGADVLDGSSPRQALRELLRRGLGERRGLDELNRQLWQRRRELQRNNRLDGTLQQVRELLDRALTAERQALARQDSDDARFSELQLDALPTDAGGAVRELETYDWQSPEGRAAYEQIRDLLGREMLDQRFAGMKQALQDATPQDVQAIRDMLDDLNKLLSSQARALLPGGPPHHRRAHRRPRREIGGRATDDELAVRRPARRAGRVDRAGVRRPAAGAVAGPARRDAAAAAARAGLGRLRPVPRRQSDGHG